MLCGLIPLSFFALLLAAEYLIDYGPWTSIAYPALLDVILHGTVSAFVLLPALWAPRRARPACVLVAFSVGALLDLDHFLFASRWTLEGALNLPVRPPTHSLTFSLLISLLVLLLTRSRIWSWALFAALASHVVRDAADGAITPLLYPLPPFGIPYAVFIAFILLLYFSSWGLFRCIAGDDPACTPPEGA
jgi:hypothetical protein